MTNTPSKENIFRIIFYNEENVYEIYCRGVSESEMFSFIEVEDLVFGDSGSVVVDPSVERLKAEFSGVTRFYIPAHSIIRIDEVEKEGVAKVHDKGDKKNNVSHFPTGMASSTGDKDKR